MCGKIKCKEMIIIEKAFYVIHFSMNGNRSYQIEAYDMIIISYIDIIIIIYLRMTFLQ